MTDVNKLIIELDNLGIKNVKEIVYKSLAMSSF